MGCGPQVSFSAQVQPIFDNSCLGNCHAGRRPSANLDLGPGRSHAAMVGVMADCNDGRLLVAPGSADTSHLVQKVTGVNMCGGNQMPGGNVPPLTQVQLDLIRAWVCHGAPNN